MSKRSKTAQFRITPEEDAHLRAAAKDAGFGQLSEYLRAVTLHDTVVVVGAERVIAIPSTVSSEAEDELVRERLRAVLIGLRTPPGSGQEESQAPTGGSVAGTFPPGSPTEATPAPDSPPATPASPGPSDGDSMVGASAPSSPAEPALPATGSVAPGETFCSHCGGTDGQHQSFCEAVTGHSPVPETEAAPEGTDDEAMRRYVETRVNEGEHRLVAEAEWRQRSEGTPPPATEQAAQNSQTLAACPGCGAMKSPAAQCADCGRRPD